jgi:mono/diheme cytochrome c family protein
LLVLSVLSACKGGRAAASQDDSESNFANICARCHGAEGSGGVPITPGGNRPRDLTDPVWQGSVSDAQIETTIRTGKDPMPAFHALLTDEQIKALVGKVRRLRKGATK